MGKVAKRACLTIAILISVQGYSQQLIQATMKMGANPDEVDIWLKPNFNNSTQYLAQIVLPIAWPIAAPSPTLTVTQDPIFVSTFKNYSVYVPTSTGQNTAGTERYKVIVLNRIEPFSALPQTWSAGVEFKLLTIKFSPFGSPGTAINLADYQDGGSDGTGNFYTASGNANFYVTSNSIGNFYATPGQSTLGGTASAGYIQTNSTIPVSCIAPTLSVNNITTTSADITWPAISGATGGYEYYISTTAGAPASGTSTTSNSFNASGLVAATQYYVYVRSNCGSGSFSGWANTNFTTASAPCNAPLPPVASNITITTADITWNTVSGATGYEYVLSTSSATPASAPGTGSAVPGTTYSASGLIGGTQYYFFVRTNCGNGNFSPWVSTNFLTQPPLCAAPTTPTFGGITTTTANINWNSISGSSGYEYVITTISGTPSGAGTVTTGTGFNPTGLIPGITYYVYVRNNCGGGLYSSWTPASFNTLCPTPGPVTVNGITASGATINWNGSGAVNYQYEISTSLTPPVSGTTISGTSYTATGLASGISYYAHVRAMCAAGNFSEWVDVPFVTTCTTPGPINVTGISPTGASISWGSVSNAEGYEYSITTASTPTAPGTPISSTGVSPLNLINGTQYNVFVRTKCSPGVFSDWIMGSFTTTFPPCVSPTDLKVSTVNDKVTFNWLPASGAAGYEYFVSTNPTFPGTGGTFTSSTSASVSGLNPSTRYYVYVRTQCGTNRYSQPINETFLTICYKPVIYLVNNLPTLGSAELGWHSIKGALKYEYAILNNAASPAGSINFTSDTIIHTNGLVPGNKYYLHVRAHCTTTSMSVWSVQDFYASGLSVYSNGNTFIISTFGTEIQNEEVSLFDVSGKLLRVIKLTRPNFSLEMNSYAAGIYYIKYGKNRQTIKKIIKL